MAILCLCTTAQEQTIEPLYTGERLPDVRISHILNYQLPSAPLSAFQHNYSRLILLDFWNTSCIPCIRAFAKLDSLQQEFGGQIQILLVTTEDSNTVKKTVARWEQATQKKLHLPLVVQDTLLSRYIRRGFNPHYAWIAPDGVLLAQTNATFITRDMLTTYTKTIVTAVEQRGYKQRDIKTKLKNQ